MRNARPDSLDMIRIRDDGRDILGREPDIGELRRIELDVIFGNRAAGQQQAAKPRRSVKHRHHSRLRVLPENGLREIVRRQCVRNDRLAVRIDDQCSDVRGIGHGRARVRDRLLDVLQVDAGICGASELDQQFRRSLARRASNSKHGRKRLHCFFERSRNGNAHLFGWQIACVGHDVDPRKAHRRKHTLLCRDVRIDSESGQYGYDEEDELGVRQRELPGISQGLYDECPR